MPASPDATQPDRDDPSALLGRAARGDESAWRGLIGMYGRRVYAMVRSRCRRDDLAEEITQSVFATLAIQLLRGGYSERGRFESWLFRVAMNRVRDEVRRARSRPGEAPVELAEAVAAPSASEHAEARDVEALRTALARLADSDREVIELRHHAGLAFARIAEVLGEPIGTVLARHHRALRKLRTMLEGGPHDEPA